MQLLNHISDADERYMYRCLDLAERSISFVAPNPMVGAVLVAQGRIIGEGRHEQYGQAHAEVMAINSVRPEDRHLLTQSTLYVSLEPCTHFGKTPPCADLIVHSRIPRVVIACPDPFPLVAGQGIRRLAEAGIETKVGILEKEAEWVNRRFITFHKKHRPYIILKWAQTSNGFFAPHGQKQQWISNAQTQILTHRWRSEEAAIMVGTNTLQADNPQLNTRLWPMGKPPVRITLIDGRRRCGVAELMRQNLHFFDQKQASLVFCGYDGELPKTRPNLQFVPLPSLSMNPAVPRDNVAVIAEILNHLAQQQHVLSLLVEGGRQLIDAFLAGNYVDELRIFEAPLPWTNGIFAPQLPASAQRIEATYLGDNKVEIWINKEGVF